MIVITLSGGLGNQMFQFCLYEKLKQMGRDVYLDASAYDDDTNPRKYELNKFSGLDNNTISFVNDSYRVKSGIGDLIFIPKRWLFKKIGHVYNDKIAIYQPEVFNMDWFRLDGYWQNEDYFKDIREDILECFTFNPEGIDQKNKETAEKMMTSNSVSLHVRRGDYLTSAYQHVYSNICSVQYYKRATEYICQNIDNLFFFIFSDDIEWCKENIRELFGDGFDESRIAFIDYNHGDQSYLDMYLMSKCRHHIIANSTFSWWGAWLGTNEDKIVVAPDRWFANHDVTDIICDDWVRIEGK